MHVSKELSVVIPAYNEAGRIEETIKQTVGTLRDAKIPHFELVIVDDGSGDHTDAVVRKYIQKQGLEDTVRLISYPDNVGKGWALKRGFNASSGRFVAFFDADLDIAPEFLVQYYHIIKTEDVDCVLGSKRHPQSSLEYARSRVWISNIYYLFNRVFFNLKVKDTQSGIKIFNRAVLATAMPKLLVKRFAFDLELLINIIRQGGRIREAPLTISGHTSFGRIGLISLWHSLVDTLGIFYRLYILRFYKWKYLPGSHRGRTPKVSILLPVEEYSSWMQWLMEKYRELDYPDYEILILSSEKHFTAAGAKIVETGSQDTFDKYRQGIKKARGSVVLFADQSMIPFRDWLSLGTAYLAHENIEAVFGPSLASGNEDFSAIISGSVQKHPFISGTRRFVYSRARQRELRQAPFFNIFMHRDRAEALFAGAGSANQEKKAARSDSKKADGLALDILRESLLDRKGKRILYAPDLGAKCRQVHFWHGYLPEVALRARLHAFVCAHVPGGNCRIRYFFPAFLSIVFILGAVFSFFLPGFDLVYCYIMAAYFLFTLLFTGRFLNIHIGLLSMFGVFAIHLVAGIRFLYGLFSEPLVLPYEAEEDADTETKNGA